MFGRRSVPSGLLGVPAVSVRSWRLPSRLESGHGVTMKRVIGIVGLLALNAAIFAWNAFTFTMDWVGRSTVVDDFQDLQQKLPDVLQWIYTSTPWWTPTLLAFLTLAALVVLAWPTSDGRPAIAGPAQAKNPNPIPSIAAQMRYAKGRFANAKKGTEDRFTRVDMRTLNDARHKFRATEISLQKLGLKTPWLDYEVDPLRFILTNLEYIEKVEPLLTAGHMKEARAQAEIIVAKLHPNFVDPNRL
jgi:hypothetical protein